MPNPATRKNAKKVRPIDKPYLRGNMWSGLAVVRGLKLLLYPFVFLLMNLFVGAAFAFEGSLFLRIVLNAVLVMFSIALLFNAGQNAGYGDISFAEIMYNHQQEGKAVSKADKDRCYHPLKGAVTALVGYLPLLILALIFALTAKQQELALPALPSWVSAYDGQTDFIQPLRYYRIVEPVTAGTILQVVMRLLIYPYINMVGARNVNLTLLMDRLSPLTLCLPYIGYAVGYGFGRRSRALLHGNMAAADRKRRRKAKQKAPRQKSKTELV